MGCFKKCSLNSYRQRQINQSDCEFKSLNDESWELWGIDHVQGQKSESSSFCEGIYLDESWASENIQLRIITHKSSIQTLTVHVLSECICLV